MKIMGRKRRQRRAAIAAGKPLTEEDYIRMVGLDEFRRQVQPKRQHQMRVKLDPDHDPATCPECDA